MIVSCEVCNNSVYVRPSHYKRGQGRFCSHQCRNKERWDRYYAKIAEEFWPRVDRVGGEDACWPYTRNKRPNGYGRLIIRGRSEAAHRVAYRLAKGEIPDGLFVCHACDNPICCNPGHLWLGTHQDNMDDCVRKGRKRGRFSKPKAQEARHDGN